MVDLVLERVKTAIHETWHITYSSLDDVAKAAIEAYEAAKRPVVDELELQKQIQSIIQRMYTTQCSEPARQIMELIRPYLALPTKD